MTSYGSQTSQVQAGSMMRACPAVTKTWPAFPSSGGPGAGIATAHNLGLDRLEELPT